MSNFLKSTPFETAFDGDTVKCRFKSIKQADSLRILALRKEDGSFMNADLLPLYSEMLPGYTEEFAGLRDQAGTPIELSDVLPHTYFSALILQMGAALSKTGRLPDPKAPASQQDATSAA